MRYVDVSADARSRYSPRLILALSAALLAVAAGCEAPSETPAPQSAPVTVEPTAPVEEGCSEAFSRTLSPKRIDGGKHLYFESADLAFLLDPSVRLQSLDLALTLRGDRKKDKADPALALNGIEAYGADQFPFYKVNRYDPATDASQCEFKLHKLRLNGADPLDWMMAKILKNKGEVKISLHGKSVNILAASVTVTGRDVDQCGPAPSPTPTSTTPPPPVPVAPKTFISAVEPSASPASSTSIQFTLGSDQLGVSYECVLDNGAPSPCTSPQIYSNLANGSHSFSVKATNSAGLSDTVGAAYAWVIDSVAPSVELLNAAVLPSVSASSSIALVFAAVDASATTFSCSLDGGPAIACESPAAYTGLGEGAHSIAVSAVDAAGNVSSAPATFSWSIDQTAPEARITSVVPAEPVTRSVAATFSFSANESASFECSVDGGSFRECASPYALPDVLDGSHGFQVRAIDVAGNLGAVATYYWTVDTVAPVL
ncbi:MAG: hypothetical protein NDJ90_15050, partial [Oligoflexia bacterium]|nr:hypothetical protein [Oligoflexia bacterium]